MKPKAKKYARTRSWCSEVPPERWARFLKLLAYRGNVLFACRQSRLSRATAYRRRRHDEKFRQEWDEAIARSDDL